MHPVFRPRALAAAIALALVPLVSLSPSLDGQTVRRDVPPTAPLIGFGTSTVVAGDEIFVGRPDQVPGFPMPPAAPGAVVAFRRGVDAWAEHAVVSSDDVEVGDAFGATLAVEGDVMVVGAPMQGDGRGAVYVFERDGFDGAWRQTARLALEVPAEGDELGAAIALSGSTAWIGAPGRGSGGAVYAFERDGSGSWTRLAELSPMDGAEGGRFGAALDVLGNRLLVGAPGPFALPLFGSPPQFQPGAAYLFERADGAWERRARLALEGGAAFGFAVLLDEDEALVSSPIAEQGAGTVLRFAPDASGAWTRAGVVAPSEAEPQALFGFALARAGADLLVGAPGAGGFHGTAYVLRQGEDGAWAEVDRLEAETQGLMGFFGSALTASVGLAAVGAPAADFFEGVGFLFTRGDGGEWSAEGRIVDSGGGLEPITGGERSCEDGAIGEFTCDEVDLVSFLPVREIGGGRGVMVNDLWGWTDPDTGREYAIVGRFDGTAFVDVSDPENPVYVGSLPLTEGAQANLWRDMKVYRNHVFIVADGAGPHGVQVFDLTELRDVADPPVEFAETGRYDRIHSAHNIVIDEETGFAYAVGASMGGETCGGALHMIDIRDPRNPTFAGCYADPATGNAGTGYTHDAQCVVYRGPDADYEGREICFNASETALGIGDVTDKENPTPIAHASYPNVAYAHQGWLSEDHRYFFLDDELDELSGGAPRTRTLVWDIQDLDDPVLATEFLGTTGASDHNLYVRGQLMYQSNYVSGLRLIDVSDPESPEEVGWFDTVPWGEDAPGFAGSWSNYPFFESGIVLVSSMREGLFVLRKRQPELVP